MYNFFVKNDQISGDCIKIMGTDVNHIKNVLRMEKNQKILISNKETGESFLSEIVDIDKKEVTCKKLEINKTTESPINITIYQGLPKSDKMEYIIQKSVELGASKIVPVEMKHCIAKINEKDREKKRTRWQTIAEAASKQSKRNKIPEVSNIINLQELKNEIKLYDLTILAYENEHQTTIKKVLENNKKAKSIALIIGPEGGLSEEEVKNLITAGAKEASLGNRILRTETASVAMLSMLMYEYEFQEDLK